MNMTKFKIGDRVTPTRLVGTVISICGDRIWVDWDERMETTMGIDHELLKPFDEEPNKGKEPKR